MSALGAFAGGMGNALFAGKEAEDRKAAQELANRSLDIEERRIAAGAYDQPQYQRQYGTSPQGGMGTRPTNSAPRRPGPSAPPDSVRERDPRLYSQERRLNPDATAPAPMGNNRLWDLVDATEGGGDYNTLFGYSNNGGRFGDVRVSEMTLGELRDFSNTRGEYGQWVRQQLANSGQRARVATPMGRFQIVGTTMRNTQDALGLPDDTVFDATTQRRMADHLAQQRLAGAETMAGKMRALRAEWEGFKHVSDADLRAAILDFERRG